jgi:hypothetical protein
MGGWDWVGPGRALVLGLLALVAGCSAQPLTGPGDLPKQRLQDAGLAPPSCPNSCCNFVAPNCPPTAPAPGTPCGQSSSAACEYGDDSFSACNTVMRCAAGSWTLQQSLLEPVSGCPTAGPSCPASFASAMDGGIDCPQLNFNCVYPEGVCVCDGDWACTPLPNDCPATRPRAGTPCNPDGGGCQRWGSSCTADAMVCECGIWSPVICFSEG